MNLNISRVRSERGLGIGCSAYRQQGLLRGWESFVSLSTSDFAGDASRLQRFRHTEERELETFTPVADEVELIRKRRPR
jgi:hypothetical protein